MKKIVFSFLLMLIFIGCSDNMSSDLKEGWQSSREDLSVPESVVYYKDNIYVSNVNSKKSKNPWIDNGGFISKLDKSGKVIKLKWAVGLKAPKGITVYRDSLYVADLDEVVKIDISSGKVLDRAKAPKGVVRLNDIVCSRKRESCFVSDSGTKKIFEVSESGDFKLLYDKEKSPKAEQNGLFIDGDSLIMQGEVGKLKSLDLNGHKVTTISNSVGVAIDGITKYKDKGYIVSTWSGGVYLIDNRGKSKKLLGDRFNTADIYYSKELDLLLVPNFDKSILAYRVSLK